LVGHRFAGDHVSLLQLPQAELLATIMIESLSHRGLDRREARDNASANPRVRQLSPLRG
jgi:hypothetical protein